MSTMKAAALVLSAVLLTTASLSSTHAQSQPWATLEWSSAHVTTYGSESGLGDWQESMGGACGFTDMQKYGYGVNNAAVSEAMFNGGLTCGACFEIKCDEASSEWCFKNGPSIYPTATNLCPNSTKPSDNGGWCNAPRVHFDLARPLFLAMAPYEAGIVPVMYRRVSCQPQGGVRFLIDSRSNSWWMLINIYNMANWGTAASVSVKLSSSADWSPMSHNFGALWDYQSRGPTISDQSFSFRITTSNGQNLVVMDAVPARWSPGATYEPINQANFQV